MIWPSGLPWRQHSWVPTGTVGDSGVCAARPGCASHAGARAACRKRACGWDSWAIAASVLRRASARPRCALPCLLRRPPRVDGVDHQHSRADPLSDFVDVLWENRYRQRCGASFLHVGQDPADPGDVEDQELLFTLASLAHTDPTAVTQACGISGQALTVYEAALEIITHLSGRLDLHVDADSQDHLAYGCRVAARFLTAPDPRTALAYAARHKAFGGDFIPFGPAPRSERNDATRC